MKKVLLLLALVFVISLPAITVSAKETTNSEGNLLKNGSFEETEEVDGDLSPKYWKEGSKDLVLWAAVLNTEHDVNGTYYTEGKDVYDGDYITWPKRRGCENAVLYQTVDISEINKGEVLVLSGMVCNYDQSPNDQAVLRLEILDADNKVISKKEASQRNPKWKKLSLTLTVPQGAVKARVKLIANRFVGSDNDAYFDDIRLDVADKKIESFFLKGNEKAKAGSSDQLEIIGGTSTQASEYDWESSYEEYATVDENGKVTFTDKYVSGFDENENNNDGIGVTIYATDKTTGIVASFTYGKGAENDNPENAGEGKVLPPTTEIKSLTKASKAFTVKWKKQSDAEGYEIQYSTAKTFKSKKTVTIKKASTVSKKIKSLKSKKTYYVRIRTYKTIDGKKVYSGWSKVKSIKTK